MPIGRHRPASTASFGRVVRPRNCACLACQAERIATGHGAIRHDLGTGYERALSEFGTHRDLPANQRSAMEAIRRHAEHRQTSIASVHWLDYDDDRIRPVIVDFADGTHCWVSWGWVCHYAVNVPGADEENGEWTTWLPENRRQDGRRRREREWQRASARARRAQAAARLRVRLRRQTGRDRRTAWSLTRGTVAGNRDSAHIGEERDMPFGHRRSGSAWSCPVHTQAQRLACALLTSGRHACPGAHCRSETLAEGAPTNHVRVCLIQG